MADVKLLGTFGDQDNNDFVSTVGAQSIAGTKTFTAAPKIPNGTTTTPGIGFSSDAGTGIARSTSSRLDFITSGTNAGYFTGTNLVVNGYIALNAAIGNTSGSVSIGSTAYVNIIDLSTLSPDGLYLFSIKRSTTDGIVRGTAQVVKEGTYYAVDAIALVGISLQITGSTLQGQRTSGSSIGMIWSMLCLIDS